MLNLRINIRWRTIAKVFSSSISVVLLLLSLVTVYFAGLLQGYSLGQTDTVSPLETTFSTTPVPTKSFPSPQPPPSISWGGPGLWEAVNKRRIELGVNSLRQRDELCTIASIRLNQLLELDKLDAHEGFTNLEERRPDLSWIFEKYSTIAEFLAQGGDSPQETVSLWENTLGHKKLLSAGEYVWGCIYAQNSFAVAIAAF